MHCKRCALLVLRGGKGVVVREEAELVLESDGNSNEVVEKWIEVKDMYDFDNVAFSREHKNLPGGKRLLTCAGCEKGIFGKAVPIGNGPEVKMQSMVAPGRLEAKKKK